jgi:hypothetical protein
MNIGSKVSWAAIVLVVCLLAVTSAAYGAGGKQESQALGFGVQPNSRISLCHLTGVKYQELYDGRRLDAYFTDSAAATVNGIYVTFLYDHTAYHVKSLDTSQAQGFYNFTGATITLDTTTAQDMAIVSITNFTAAHFTNTKLFGLWVESHCQPSGASHGIRIADSTDFPTGSLCQFNMSNGASRYYAKRDSGYVSVVGKDLHMSFAAGTVESTYVSGQVKAMLRIWSNFAPRDSFSAVITYDTIHLHYDSVSVVDAWAGSGLSVYHGHDTLIVGEGDNTLPAPGETATALAFFYFTTTNVCEYGGLYDLNVPTACAYACPSYGGSAYVGPSHIGIWKYLATFELDHVWNGPNMNILQPARLGSNFPVLPLFGPELNSPGIAFHFRQASTSHALYDGVDWQEWIENPGGVVFWTSINPASGHTIKTTDNSEYSYIVLPATESYDLPRIAHLKWTTKWTNGTDSTILETLDSTDTYLKPAPEEADLPMIRAYGHDNISFLQGAVTLDQETGCPLLFAWDGSRFAEENTIIGDPADGALPKPAPDYYRLMTNLQPRDGYYTLQIRESEKEESNFDNFELTVVDHPQGTTANVSRNGEIQVYRGELLPFSAVDEAGVDQLAKILDEDGKFFSSSKAGSLTLTYLVGKNFNGESVALTNNPPPPTEKEYAPGWDIVMMRKIAATESLPPKTIVKTEILSPADSWVELDYARNRAMNYTDVPTFNLADYQRDGQIIIRESWDVAFTVDKISILLPSSEPSTMTKVGLVTARHSVQGNITDQVLFPDEVLATLVPGESIELQFADPTGPTTRSGYVRDFVFSANGYYTSYKGSAAVPETYRLLQNYPNPFNPSTTIYYNLVSTTNVDLAVYNMIGQRVKTLVSAVQEAGTQSSVWDGTDESGRPVASGIYLYRLMTPDYSSSRKMILMK